MESTVYFGLARNKNVRVMIADTTSLVESARKVHDLYPTSNAALGRVMSIGAIMGLMQKEDSKILININGGGPIGTIMVEADNKGHLRGFVGDNTIYLKYNSNNKLAVGIAVGNDGYLKVTRNMGLKSAFNSSVKLQTGEIGDDFAYYFTLSEQVPSLVSVGVLVDNDYSTKASGALLIQMMPGASEEDISYVENIASKLEPISTVIDRGQDLKEYLKTLFEDIEILDKKEVSYVCDCNKERFMEGLLTLNDADLQEVLKDEVIEVKCEYCNKIYHITHDELLNFKNEN